MTRERCDGTVQIVPDTRDPITFFFFFLVKDPVISLYRNTEDSATRIFANSETWRMGLFDELLLRVLQYIRVAETGT